MPLGNVVLGTDFSQSAAQAAARACRLPLGRDCFLTLVHALPPNLPARVEQAFRAAATRKLEEAKAKVGSDLDAAGRRDVNLLAVLDSGRPAEIVCARAHDGRAELVVVGRGQRPHSGAVGSIAERTVRMSHTAVLVVVAPPAATYQRPLAAVDLTDLAAKILAFVARLCPEAHTLAAVHAYLPEGVDLSGLLREGGMTDGEIQDYVRSVESEARRDLAARLPPPGDGLAIDLSLRTGDPRTAILDEIARRRADVVALGATSHSRLTRLFLGSVSEEILRTATCDVLVVR